MPLYVLSNSEYMQFKIAAKRLKELQQRYAIELDEAYDGIHPTRVCFDYGLGRLYSESLNPADYAIYLVDLQEEHKAIENYWFMRAETYKKALKIAISGEREEIRAVLSQIVSERPELQRKESVDLDDDVEEYDRKVDGMSWNELKQDYYELYDEEVSLRG